LPFAETNNYLFSTPGTTSLETSAGKITETNQPQKLGVFIRQQKLKIRRIIKKKRPLFASPSPVISGFQRCFDWTHDLSEELVEMIEAEQTQ
jgi:hypothetical protein